LDRGGTNDKSGAFFGEEDKEELNSFCDATESSPLSEIVSTFFAITIATMTAKHKTAHFAPVGHGTALSLTTLEWWSAKADRTLLLLLFLMLLLLLCSCAAAVVVDGAPEATRTYAWPKEPRKEPLLLLLLLLLMDIVGVV